LAYYIQLSLFITDDALLAMLAPNHSNARAAVLRLLFNPASAQFDLLKTVDVDAAKYVCGNVNAKDESGSYAGYHAFVYIVAVDFARIDDEGRIAQRHAAFSACPMSDEEMVAQQKTSISPGALSLVKAIQKIYRHQVIHRRCQKWRRKCQLQTSVLPVRRWNNSWVNWAAVPFERAARV
jgi:hypothetical protein